MRQHDINQQLNHIEGYYIEDTSFCDTLIKYLEDDATVKGKGYVGTQGQVKLNVKDSTDCTLYPDNPMADLYLDHMTPAAHLYTQKYERLIADTALDIREPFNIQKYEPPTGGFPEYHHERKIGSMSEKRALVFMTYLNDVDDGGETEFLYQQVKIKPEKGLTLFFPPEWTYTHRGNIVNSTKYIVTGWFHYTELNDGI
jgi:prolyl 4-hydroxylase